MDPDEAARLVQRVLDDVSRSFQRWKEDYARQALAAASLAPPRPIRAPSHEQLEYAPDPSMGSVKTSRDEYIEHWDIESGTSRRVKIEVTRLLDASRFSAAPAYEYCAPVARNITFGDDSSWIPFFPYPDDPTFNLDDYLDHFSGVLWQRRPDLDPDLQLIVIEVARRVQSESDLSLRDIDNTRVLPLCLLAQTEYNDNRFVGTIKQSHQRDLLPWPPGVPDSEKRLPVPITEPSSAEESLDSIVVEFCANLNCCVGFCPTHLQSHATPHAGPPATIRNERLRHLVRESCSSECFLNHEEPDEDIISQLSWDQQTLEIFRITVKHSADTLPCDLATICAKPCFEAYIMRCREVAIPRKRTRGSKSKPVKMQRKIKGDIDPKNYDNQAAPCHHEGPCDASSECPCFIYDGHCELTCRCSDKCHFIFFPSLLLLTPAQVRVVGAGVPASNVLPPMLAPFVARAPASASLPTASAIPKCALNVKQNCQAGVCQNMNIQWGKFKKTRVAPGVYGLGLFMCEPVLQNDLIIEYVGQVIFEETVNSREAISLHRNRNYVFQLNTSLAIDGAHAGNTSRYINHTDKNPNCTAQIKLVNGQHRIGIYALRDLKDGEEVFFDYGPDFFKD
ncbi:Pre-mRNA splicing factor [Mycena kentingensis (nom. inval.)]|nr:Pre-mRNA splicing factor [Mycena kentingensis (nom. inval.)]